jgi:hypothetical protein
VYTAPSARKNESGRMYHVLKNCESKQHRCPIALSKAVEWNLQPCKICTRGDAPNHRINRKLPVFLKKIRFIYSVTSVQNIKKVTAEQLKRVVKDVVCA